MISKELGKTTEKVPAIGIGTWKLGINPEEEVKSIKYGISKGMRLIDTAEMYHTENIVAQAIRSKKGIFVATKASPHHFHYDDVINSCNQSLSNLRVSSIDLYQLHWPNPNIPIQETMKAMEQLVKDGKIRHIGVCNFTVDELKEARGVMKSNEIVSNQVEYSVFARGIEDEVLPYCQKEGITVIAYSPLAMGKLTEKGTKAYEVLSSIANAHSKTISQIALNWLISKRNVIAIPKASSSEHMIENAGSCDFKLTKSDLQKIDSINTNYRPISGRINKFTKSTSSVWSSLMDKREGFRSKYKL